MFKKATLRFFAGMLFGSVAGVFLGVGFAALLASHLPQRAELDQMRDLLNHVMIGAFFGLAFGGIIALGRRPLLSALVSTMLGALGAYLSIAFFGPEPDASAKRLFLAGGAMVLGAVLAEIVGRVFARGEAISNNGLQSPR
jgi:hypothetical protein